MFVCLCTQLQKTRVQFILLIVCDSVLPVTSPVRYSQLQRKKEIFNTLLETDMYKKGKLRNCTTCCVVSSREGLFKFLSYFIVDRHITGRLLKAADEFLQVTLPLVW